MSQRRRTLQAAIEAVVFGVVILIAYALHDASRPLALVINFFGACGLGHALAVGLGFIPFPPPDQGDSDSPEDDEPTDG
jgi:hypothetical protein